jgi:hypothetical protein
VNDCEQRGYTCKVSCDVGEEIKADYNVGCIPQKCCGPASQKTCSQQGDVCCTKCAYDTGHQTDLDTTCSYGDLCCTQCQTEQSCSDLNGEICNLGEKCTTTPELTSDGNCCLGTCEKVEQTCAELGGTLCDSSKCTAKIEMAADGNCCVGGECKTTSLTWLYVILGLGVIAAVIFFLNKKGIIKFGGKGKGKPSTPSTFAPPATAKPTGSRPAVKPLMPWPGVQQPAQPAPQRTSKRPDEFEETFKKLKEMQ